MIKTSSATETELSLNHLETQMPIQPPTDKKNILIAIMAISILILLSILTFQAKPRTINNSNTLIQPTISPQTLISPSIPETTKRKTYNSVAMGFTFQYPVEYNAPEESGMYLSIISPLNRDRPLKATSLVYGELKIEIIAKTAEENDSTDKCIRENAGDGKITGQADIVIDGIKTQIYGWEGYGTSQLICIIRNGKRYSISKYPQETSRQSEFDQILSSFRFLDQPAQAPNSPTMYPNSYSYPSKSSGCGFSLTYPAGWSYLEADGIGDHLVKFRPGVKEATGGSYLSIDRKNPIPSDLPANIKNYTIDGLAATKETSINDSTVILVNSGECHFQISKILTGEENDSVVGPVIDNIITSLKIGK